MLPSVNRTVDVGTNTSRALNSGRASNTGWGSDVIVLEEARGFYSRKYGTMNHGNSNNEGHTARWTFTTTVL